jgi:hypothetical protein
MAEQLSATHDSVKNEAPDAGFPPFTFAFTFAFAS